MADISGELREVDWREGARLIDECAYLFARDVREVSELTLRLILVEAKAQAPLSVDHISDPVERLRVGGRPIEEDETCRRFEVLFHARHLISYTVTDETYGKYPEPPEAFTGKLFRVFSRSHLMELVERTTYASGGYPAPLMHFEIACLNHVFDVICTAPPAISVAVPFVSAPLIQ